MAQDMAQDYQHLWKTVASATDETQAAQTLAKILADKQGRAFISRLERNDVELCVEILDMVSRDARLHHSSLSQTISSGSYEAKPQPHRQTVLHHHLEETH